MSIYSMQFKAAQNAFGKQRVTLSGKVGGMKDDVVFLCVCVRVCGCGWHIPFQTQYVYV